jgi:ankyrin repeat protein
MRLDHLPPPPDVNPADYDLGNSRNSSGWAALHRAAARGQTEAAKYLLNAAYPSIKCGKELKTRPAHFKPHWIHMRTAYGISQKEIKVGDHPRSVSRLSVRVDCPIDPLTPSL